MKNKKINKESLHESILQSAIASARLEGIIISDEVAKATLKKVLLNSHQKSA